MKEKILGQDKIYHIVVCFVISFINTELAIGCAIGKEYGDSKAQGNHWCWWDILADIIGIVLGSLLRYILIGRLRWI